MTTAEEYFNEAVELIESGDYGELEEAVEKLSKCIDLAPMNADAYYNRGYCYSEMAGRIIITKNNEITHDSEQYKEAIKDFTKAIKIDADANAYVQRALCYKKLKEYEKAIEDFSEVFEIVPVPFYAHYCERGRCYLELKEYKKAKEDFTEAIELCPRYDLRHMIYELRACCNESLELYEEAVEDFTMVIELSVNYTDYSAYYDRGLCFEKLERYEEAVKDFTKIINEDKLASDECWYHRGRCYKRLGKYEEAIEDFEEVYSFDDCLEYYLDKAYSYSHLKQFEEAIETLTEAIEMIPEAKAELEKEILKLNGDRRKAETWVKAKPVWGRRVDW